MFQSLIMLNLIKTCGGGGVVTCSFLYSTSSSKYKIALLRAFVLVHILPLFFFFLYASVIVSLSMLRNSATEYEQYYTKNWSHFDVADIFTSTIT